MSWELDGKPIRSVLLTRLRYLGDIVMSTVLVEALRRGDPDLEIGYLCEEGFAPVLHGHTGIDRLHRLRTGKPGRNAARRVKQLSTGDAHGTPGLIRDLRRFRYDLAVDMFFNPRSAWLLRLSGIPLRIGGTDRPRGRLYSHRALRRDIGEDHREFDRIAPGGLGEHLCRLGPLVHSETGAGFADWLATTFRPGELKPVLGPGRTESIPSGLLSALGVAPGDPYLLLAPCATWVSKEWPRARWGELVSLLVESLELNVVVMVAPGKEDAWSGLAELIPPGRGGVLPPLPLDDALAVTASARALVTVDGGIMHAAVGLDVPTLAIFGPTDPAIWFPYERLGPFRVMAREPYCHPCDLHECPAFVCLPELEPAEVRRSLAALLEGEIRTEGEAT
ncbi:MAG: glycosyltransferase family 9 protein [Candidatus Krumholzibacteriota bacterium]